MEKQLTPEEMDEIQRIQAEFYDKQTPHLQKIRNYEVLQAEIDEARLRSAAAKARLASLHAPPIKENFNPTPERERVES